MSLAVTLLSYEHGILMQVIDVLNAAVEQGKTERHRSHMAEVVRFLEVYMDQFHHGKEEQFLFPSVIRASPLLNAEIPRLIRDHQRARDLLTAMASGINSGDVQKFGDASKTLVEHMTAHINKEEGEIFPRIEAVLATEEGRRLNKEYRDFNKHFAPDYYGKSEEFAKRVQDEILGSNYFKKPG